MRGLLAQRDTARAKIELESLTKQFPDAAAVHVLNGLLKGSQRDEAGARKHFARALELEPDSTEALGGLVALALWVGPARRKRGGRTSCEPSGTSRAAPGARTYAANGDPKKAEELASRHPGRCDTPEAYTMLAQLYISRGVSMRRSEFENLATGTKPVAALTCGNHPAEPGRHSRRGAVRARVAVRSQPPWPRTIWRMHAESRLSDAAQLAQRRF